jgi:Bacterial Ig-like domain (group 2)
MRAQYPFTALLSAAALLAACETNTSPDLPPDELGPTVLNVAPSFATIEGERFVRLAAKLSGSAAGTPQELVTWISSDTNIATVTRGGLVEGRKAGRVLITASWESAQGSATVVVVDRVSKKPEPEQKPGSAPCKGKC